MHSNVSSEPSTDLAPSPPVSAGAQLRAHREAQGLSDDALAQTLHVPVAKLRALEADQFEALPDAMFARALALTVCRHLQVDPAPVLAGLPARDESRLAARDERGLDSPLQRPSLLAISHHQVTALLQARWLTAVLVLAVLGYAVVQWRATGVATTVETTQPEAAAEVTQPVVVTPVAPPVAQEAVTAPSVAPAAAKADRLVVTPVQTTPIVLAPTAPVAPSTEPAK